MKNIKNYNHFLNEERMNNDIRFPLYSIISDSDELYFVYGYDDSYILLIHFGYITSGIDEFSTVDYTGFRKVKQFIPNDDDLWYIYNVLKKDDVIDNDIIAEEFLTEDEYILKYKDLILYLYENNITSEFLGSNIILKYEKLLKTKDFNL